MKKLKFLLFLPFLALIGFTFTGTKVAYNLPNQSYSYTLKATSNEDTTYTYEDDQSKYTFVLKEENVAFITFVNKQTGAEGEMDGTYLLEDKILTIKVNDEEMFKFEITEEGTLKLIKDESWKEKFMELWNQIQTFFTPLITGVSITTIISMAFTITFAVLNHRNNKTSKDTVLETTTLALNVAKDTGKVLGEIISTKKLNEETTLILKKSTEELCKQVEKVYELNEPIQKVVSISKSQCEMLSLMAANTKELVTSGTADEIKQIEMKVESI